MKVPEKKSNNDFDRAPVSLSPEQKSADQSPRTGAELQKKARELYDGAKAEPKPMTVTDYRRAAENAKRLADKYSKDAEDANRLADELEAAERARIERERLAEQSRREYQKTRSSASNGDVIVVVPSGVNCTIKIE